MFRYFWMEGKDLPDGIGFGLFTWKHFLALACCAAGIILLCRCFLKCTWKGQEKFLKWTAVSLLLGNLARDIFLTIRGRMSVDYLPFHLCSFAIFVYLLHAFMPDLYHFISRKKEGHHPRRCQHPARKDENESEKRIQTTFEDSKAARFREALGEIGFVLLMPGTICALIFPDWTRYPLWNFMCLHSFIWHAVLVAYPMMLYLSHRIHPTLRHYWYPILYLCIVTPPTAIFNALTGCNYLFIMRPLPNTPQEWLVDLMGSYWRVGYALVVAGVILAVYLIIDLSRLIRRKLFLHAGHH